MSHDLAAMVSNPDVTHMEIARSLNLNTVEINVETSAHDLVRLMREQAR